MKHVHSLLSIINHFEPSDYQTVHSCLKPLASPMARPRELSLDESSSASSPQSPSLGLPRSRSASNPSNFSKLGDRNMFTIINGGFRLEQWSFDREKWLFLPWKMGFGHEKIWFQHVSTLKHVVWSWTMVFSTVKHVVFIMNNGGFNLLNGVSIMRNDGLTVKHWGFIKKCRTYVGFKLSTN